LDADDLGALLDDVGMGFLLCCDLVVIFDLYTTIAMQMLHGVDHINI
jgi:hypothetical protein